MPPGVHPLAAPRIPTAPFRTPPKPVFNPFRKKLPKFALGRLAPRLIPGLGGLLLAWDILDWLEAPDGSPEKEPGFDIPAGWTCSKTIPYTGAFNFGPAMRVIQVGSCDSMEASVGVGGQSIGSSVTGVNGFDQAKLDKIWYNRNNVTIYTGPRTSDTPGVRPQYQLMYMESGYVYANKPASLPSPKYRPAQAGFVLPRDLLPINIPALDPNSVPIGVPVPTPHPIPVPWLPGIKPNPDRVPSERSDNGPVPKPDPWAPRPEPVSPFPPEKPFPPNPRPDPGGRPKPPVDPYVPSVDIDTGAISNNPLITPRPGRHYKRPPGSNEREKKTTENPGAYYRILNGIVGFAGEAGDVVEAVYDALPKSETRWKGRDGKWRDRDYGPIEKAKRIFNNLDKLDVDKAIENIIANEAEDRLIGGLSKGAREGLARKGWGDPNRNPFGTPSRLSDLPPIPNLK